MNRSLAYVPAPVFEPTITNPRTVNSQYLLSPLLYYSKCGKPMIGSTGKSGRYLYYRCSYTLRHDADACKSVWIPRDKIEQFVIDKLKEKTLTDGNLATLVRMVNEEIRLLSSHRQERLEEISKQLDLVNNKLLKYYTAFENGTMSDNAAAPRIRELRTEQIRLQKANEEALADLDDTEPKELDTRQVMNYVEDIRTPLSTGTFLGQKSNVFYKEDRLRY